MDFFKSKKGKFLIIFLVGSIIFSILSYTVRTNAYFSNTFAFIVVPIQTTFTNTSNWASEQINEFSDKNYLKDTNETLFWENEQLKAEINRLKQLEIENIKLSNLLDTAQRYPQFETKTANIIATDNNYWYKTFMLDVGTKDGVEMDMIVLSNGGLLGRITTIGHNYCKVTSIFDETNSVSVKSLRTNELGILKGSSELIGDKLAVIDYIDVDSKMVVGDEIVTSSLSDIYPGNIVVGTISNITVNDNNITKSAIVQPIVNLNNVDKVLIVTNLKNASFDFIEDGE